MLRVLAILATLVLVANGGSELLAVRNTSLSAPSSPDISAVIFDIDAPWENFITPGPTVVTLLGSLMVIASKDNTDFSLKAAMPQGGYKYIQYPDSFQATLVQIANQGWTSFNTAQTNMDKIQLYMQEVPSKVSTALKIISRGSDRLIKILLPKPIQHIGEMGKECVRLATETQDSFINVMQLIGEVIAATESSKKLQTQALKDVEAELNSTRIMAENMKSYGKLLQKKMSELNAEAVNYRHAYEKAMSDIPTGWKAIAQDFARSVVGIVKDVGHMLAIGGSGSGGSSGGGILTGGNGKGLMNLGETVLFNTMNTFAGQLMKIKDKLLPIFNLKKFTAADNPVQMFKSYKSALGPISSMIKNTPDSTSKKDASSYIQEGQQLCDTVIKAFSNPQVFPDNGTITKIQIKINGLINKVKPMTAAHAYSSQLAEGPKGDFSGPNGDARYKAYLAQRVMEDAQHRSDQVFMEFLKYQKEMASLMANMSHLNFEEINYEQILQLMRQGIRLLAQIRQQWSRLVDFFSLVAVRSEVALNETLIPFLEYSHELEGQLESPISLSEDDKQAFLELMVDQAQDIEKVTYFLYTLANTYVDVSRNFLVDRLAGLSAMLTASSEQERKTLLAKLRSDAAVATKGVESLARSRREAYHAVIGEKVAQMKAIVDQHGGPTQEDIAAADAGLKLLGK